MAPDDPGDDAGLRFSRVAIAFARQRPAGHAVQGLSPGLRSERDSRGRPQTATVTRMTRARRGHSDAAHRHARHLVRSTRPRARISTGPRRGAALRWLRGMPRHRRQNGSSCGSVLAAVTWAAAICRRTGTPEPTSPRRVTRSSGRTCPDTPGPGAGSTRSRSDHLASKRLEGRCGHRLPAGRVKRWEVTHADLRWEAGSYGPVRWPPMLRGPCAFDPPLAEPNRQMTERPYLSRRAAMAKARK